MKTRNMYSIALVLLIMGLMVFQCTNPKPCDEIKTNTDSTITTLAITNTSEDTVTAYLTLGCGPMNVNNVYGIFGIQDTALSGSFQIAPGDTLYYTPDSNKVLSGNITFNTPPLNCPDTVLFPNGINLFEFTLNNKILGSSNQETIDISCVAGLNCSGFFNMTGGGWWNAGPENNGIVFFKNDSLYKNVGAIGVYPYGCDNCTVSTAPPDCPGHKPYSKPQKSAICNVQRPCTTSGGTVLIGFITKM